MERPFGEKNLVLHGNSVYQNLVHVALMIQYSEKMGRPALVNDPVSLIDVAPTILASVGFRRTRKCRAVIC